MKKNVSQQMTKELEFIDLFEIEELEDRLEFRSWGDPGPTDPTEEQKIFNELI